MPANERARNRVCGIGASAAGSYSVTLGAYSVGKAPSRMIRLGMLTPSSNTVLEPVTARMLADVAGITAHASRFAVTEIALDAAALGQFDDAPILQAA